MMNVTNNTSFNFDPSKQYLFRRAYALTIGQVGQAPALQYSNYPKPGLENTVQPPTGLRIHFEIEKNAIGSPNKGKIEVYNLSIGSRQAIGKGTVLRLEAGYNGLTDLLFTGIVAPLGLKTERKDSNIVTTMECGDGESAIMLNKLDKAYPGGTTLAQVIGDLAVAMSAAGDGSPQGVAAGIAVGIPDVTYGSGISIHGTCKDTLNKLLPPLGLRWSIQNGALTIVPLTAHNGSTAIIVASGVQSNPNGPSFFDINKATGLIGTPSRNAQYTEFTSLLNPKLVPNAPVQLISENTSLNGFYKIMQAKYEGDTHDNKWQVKCQCIPISAVQTLPPSQSFNYSPAVTSSVVV